MTGAAAVTVGPLTGERAPEAARCWFDAWNTLRRAHHLPEVVVTDDVVDRQARRVALLAGTDPGGSWLATDGPAVCGLAQAFVRDGLWVLSLLGVAPSHQGRGIGAALLERARAYGRRADRGMILSSVDPRAKRRYVLAGFHLEPTVACHGGLDRRRLPPPTGAVTDAGDDGAAVVAAVDRKVRGAAHGPELELLLGDAGRLLVAGRRGYVVARPNGVALLAADTEAVADALLCAALAQSDAGGPVDVGRLTGRQQWAIRRCVGLGLDVAEYGSLMLRGMGPPAPYVPNGGFG